MIDMNREMEVPQELKDRIISQYQSGLTIKQIYANSHGLYRRVIVSVLREADQIKERDEKREHDPSEEEIARLALLTKDSWSDQEASSRWVGRAATKYEEAGRALSKLLRR